MRVEGKNLDAESTGIESVGEGQRKVIDKTEEGKKDVAVVEGIVRS